MICGTLLPLLSITIYKMRWIDSSVKLLTTEPAESILARIELATRTCYRSEDKITEGSAEKLIRGCLKRGHESIIEHGSLTFEVICDRGVSHQLVRHRMASYSQESTRYCAYNKDKFGNQLTFIKPYWVDEPNHEEDVKAIDRATAYAEEAYLDMLNKGTPPDIARCILPNCLATKIIVTMNMRELRHFIKLRASKYAHGDIQIIAKQMYKIIKDYGLGVFVEDIDIGDDNI